MRDAIDDILSYTVEGEATFVQDRKTQDAVIRKLQVVGEAARSVSQAFRDAHPEVAWLGAIRMRNVMVHEYFRVDLTVVWAVVERELRPLRAQVIALLE
jgi:uncharacterized protein with HEPN domain